MPDIEFHTCKGSRAIADETIAACNDDEQAAVSVLIFAACLAACMGKIPPSVLIREIEIGFLAARTLLADASDGRGMLS